MTRPHLTDQLAVGLRTLVNSTTLAATFLVGLYAARHVASKRDAIEIYKVTVADVWASLLESVYINCKQRWSYRIPDTTAEHDDLRQLCRRILDFENYALEQCRGYILEVLANGKEHHKIAIAQSLKKIAYMDAEVEAALETLTHAEQIAVCLAGEEALAHLHSIQRT